MADINVVDVELGFWDWFAKIIEKGTFLRLKVLNHKDITEEDYDLLREHFRIWYYGRHPLYQAKTEQKVEVVMQNTLFGDNDIYIRHYTL